jgi:hypothetical protein
MTARRTLTIGLPSSVELIAAGIVLALLAAGGGTLYLKGHTDGYAGATAHWQAVMAAQAAANQAALDAAQTTINQQAQDLDKTSAELDRALAEIDAGSGGTDAAELGLDAARMRALGKIR